MSLNGALSQIALKGIWSRLKCLGKNDARLAYKIFDQSEKLIVDGSHHHQYCQYDACGDSPHVHGLIIRHLQFDGAAADAVRLPRLTAGRDTRDNTA